MNGLTIFRQKTKGWMIDPDGQPFCPECWKPHLAKIAKDLRESFQKDSKPLNAVIPGHRHGLNRGKKSVASATRRNYRVDDGWYVSCEKCGNPIYVPYTAGEN